MSICVVVALCSIQTAEKLGEAGIPTTVILDSAVGYFMEQTDMVIVGAEGVVENGGIVNSVCSGKLPISAHGWQTNRTLCISRSARTRPL